ncbi:class II aldolase/adducin family protein [Sporichthya polymorpha]|uniref:class II aldolase/adducin family protein n=1 Tax=Sporichthya polymorpha TaxID=35751 RepID=UPI00036A0F84|nr:class II aldolase/adducin family protein [Sporichthya polymorpha]
MSAVAGMVAAGLVVGTAGNVSVRDGDVVAVTPSGLDYARLTPADVGLHALDGTALDARHRPSSELPLHLAVYAATDAGAVVHTHSPAATALTLLVDELPAVHYYVAMFGGPVRVAPYHPFGSDELAAATAAALDGRRGALLAHHGAVTIGADVAQALELAIVLEWLADVYLRAAAAGTPRVLPPAALARADAALAAYQAARPRPE